MLPRWITGIALALVGSLALSGSVAAQTWPSRPIRLIVSFPPGGPADLLGRFIAQKLGEGLGQQVVVDNRPGANSIIAAELTAKAPSDGHTLLMGIDGVFVMNPSLYTKLPYDPVRDFTPISLAALIPNVIVANPAFAANSVRELIAAAKARPGDISIATSALPVQLAVELFMVQSGTKLTLVPYKGGSTSISDLVGGSIALSIEGVSTALPFVRNGKVKALAVTSAERLPQAPEIPTVAESGLPGYAFNVWQSVVGPAGLPTDVVERVNAEVVRMMKTPEAAERLGALGLTPASSTPAELAARIRTDGEKWSRIIRDIGMKID
jgi:tripartite-type tricarboxylate transporter receptor subunit TctC